MEEHLSSKKICFLRYSLKMVSFKILYFVLSKHSIEHLKTKQNKNKKTSDCNWTQNQNHLVHKLILKKKKKKTDGRSRCHFLGQNQARGCALYQVSFMGHATADLIVASQK